MKQRTTLYADEGMWLTDGEHFGKTVVLAEGASFDAFREITDAEYQAEMAKRETEAVL